MDQAKHSFNVALEFVCRDAPKNSMDLFDITEEYLVAAPANSRGFQQIGKAMQLYLLEEKLFGSLHVGAIFEPLVHVPQYRARILEMMNKHVPFDFMATRNYYVGDHTQQYALNVPISLYMLDLLNYCAKCVQDAPMKTVEINSMIMRISQIAAHIFDTLSHLILDS